MDGGAWTTTPSLFYDQAVDQDVIESREVEVRAVSDAAHSRGPASSIGPPANAPQNLSLTPGDGLLGAAWDAPEDYGGPPVSGYAVQWRVGDGPWSITGVTVTNLTAEITGLTNGQAHQVRAAARNPLGVGTFTDPPVEETPVSPARDYDADNNRLIEISNLLQLNAVRYDLDGDGSVSDDASTTNVNEAELYAAAFTNPVSGMGCPSTGCIGYELSGDLDFDTGTMGDRTDDAYYDGGAGWLPIGTDSDPYDGAFDGAGHSIANLYVNRGGSDGLNYAGLFGAIGADGEMSRLSIVDASVTGDEFVGALAGANRGKVTAVSSTGSVNGDGGTVGGLVGLNRSSGVIRSSSSQAAVTLRLDQAGGLVGENEGSIDDSYATGAVNGRNSVAGLAGRNDGTGSNVGRVTASYAAGRVTADRDRAGGLVADNAVGFIIASYATGAVSGRNDVGGLVGTSYGGGTPTVRVTASFSTGAVSGGGNNVGGLIGANSNVSVVNDSYWNTETSGQSTSAAGTGHTGLELRAPTGYVGIYVNWHADLDGDTRADDYWVFGAAYNYPTLKGVEGKQQGPGPVQSITAAPTGADSTISWTEPADAGDGAITGYEHRFSEDGSTWTGWTLITSASYVQTLGGATDWYVQVRAVTDAAHTRGLPQRHPPPMDYDMDDDGLIEITSLAQLNALRWDLDGDGTPASGSETDYAAAFPDPPYLMGCPTGCSGYELTGNLDFGTWDANNAYWNGGDGWLPIGDDSNRFTATFDGNGHTIDNLFINRTSRSQAGLFGGTGAGSMVRRVNLTGVNVTAASSVGALAGVNNGTVSVISAAGSVTGSGDNVGGLVGWNGSPSRISASYSAVTVSSPGGDHVGGLAGRNEDAVINSYAAGAESGQDRLGGLVGYAESGSIVASYATGAVAATGDDAGGLAGENRGSVTASFSTGAVSAGGSNAGGLVGDNTGSGSATNSYWDTESSGQSSSDGGTGQTGGSCARPPATPASTPTGTRTWTATPAPTTSGTSARPTTTRPCGTWAGRSRARGRWCPCAPPRPECGPGSTGPRLQIPATAPSLATSIA